MTMKILILVVAMLIPFFGITKVGMTTYVLTERGTLDVNEIEISSIYNDKVQSTLFYKNFNNGDPKGHYAPNSNISRRYLHGNGGLDFGKNLLIITLKTDANTFCDSIELSIGDSITHVNVDCLIGLSKDSVSYIKKFEIRRSVGNSKKLSLKPKDSPIIKGPIIFILKNKSDNILYGNSNGNHFIGEMRVKSGLGFMRISPYRFCVPEKPVEALQPKKETECLATQEDKCESFIITEPDDYLFEIFVNTTPYNNEIPPQLIEATETYYKIIDQYRVSCEFEIK